MTNIGVTPYAVVNDIMSHINPHSDEEQALYTRALQEASEMKFDDLNRLVKAIDKKYARKDGKQLLKMQLMENFGKHQLMLHQTQLRGAATPKGTHTRFLGTPPVDPFEGIAPKDLFGHMFKKTGSTPPSPSSSSAGHGGWAQMLGRDEPSSPSNLATHQGVGLRRKKIRYGRGISMDENVIISKPRSTTHRHYVNGRYIDLNKLKDNILSVKYANNDAHLATIKVQKITDDVKGVICDIMSNSYSKRLFDKLSPDDKRIIKRLKSALKIDINIDDDMDAEFNKNYQILKGEFMSGNTSPIVIKELKQYVRQGMEENRIPRRECWQILYELSL